MRSVFFCRLYGIGEQHGDGHGTDTARNGGNEGGLRRDRREINVAAEPSVRVAVHADIYHGGTLLHHIGGDEACFPDGGNEDIRLTGDGGKECRFRVTDGNRRVRGKEKERHRRADDIGAPDDDGTLSGRVDARAADELHDPGGGAGQEARMPLGDQPDNKGMEGIHVLFGGDAQGDLPFVQMFRKRQLNEDAVDRRIFVQCVDQPVQIGLGGLRGKGVELGVDADLLAGLSLVADLDRRGGVVPV